MQNVGFLPLLWYNRNMIPEILLQRIRSVYPKYADTIEAGLQVRRFVTLRVNRLKLSTDDFSKTLTQRRISFERIAYNEDAFLLHNVREDVVMEMPEYAVGALYLQSLSSMLPPLFLAPQVGENVLDMTAAPGGKTTQLYALSHGRALITACERDAGRFERLRYNLEKQGATRVNALKTDALQLNDFLRFDKILLDAPCTGTGTIGEGSRVRFSEEYLVKCVKLQKKLIEKALRLLKTGGTLIYSTCSILPEENEEVVRHAEKLGGKVVPVTAPAGVTRLPAMDGTICVCPNERYEGFFLAKLTK